MVDEPGSGAPRGLHVVSVQAWRGRFADGSAEGLDAVVVEFGAEGGEVPPLIVPAASVSAVARVLFEAARSETRPVPATTEPVPTDGPEAQVTSGAEPGDAAGSTGEPPAGGGPVGGEAWARLLARPRHPAASLAGLDLPAAPGVYAWLRDGRPVYLGRAKSKRGLRSRIGADHLALDAELGRSGFRRTVALALGVPADADRLDPHQLAGVNAWIEGCEVVFLACPSSSEAAGLEEALRREWDPVVATG